MDGVHTHCRSRGADGVAFVVQGDSSTALGKGGLVRQAPQQMYNPVLDFFNTPPTGKLVRTPHSSLFFPRKCTCSYLNREYTTLLPLRVY